MEIVFATNNPNKLTEIQHILGDSYRVLGLEEIGFREEIPEDYHTLEENALQKARYVYERTGMNCFADDTGLEVMALEGAPGVFSARYARIGSPVFPDMEPTAGNKKKLLIKMQGVMDRRARFRTVIAVIIKDKEYLFEGEVNGSIGQEPRGNEGFGYDPLFVPDGFSNTFAQMDLSSKNLISHRSKAVQKLADFLAQM